MKVGVLSLALVILSAVGCTKTVDSSVQAAPNISDSMDVVKGDQIGVDSKLRLAVKKSALEKEFLLQGSLIPQTEAAMGHALLSRIVAFRERGGRLYMLEASAGHTVTNDLPENIVLAEFPIVREDETRIIFDFNAGMSQLFSAKDLNASDIDGAKYNAKSRFDADQLVNSFIDSANVDANNRLVIRQIAQLHSEDGLAPVEARYYITPYRPNPDYQPLQSNGNFDHYGFFQTAPALASTGDSVTYWTRWDIKKPIVYAVSSNTPADYKQAVREGILYWNKVFGREVVRVIDAPEGVTAPDPDYNVIQWVPYETAGYAYADIQKDPRTGEIQHAQVFLTSSFAYGGKSDVRRVLRRMKTETKASKVKLRGFTAETLCNYAPGEALISGLETLLESGVDDATVKKVSQDYVRSTVAHEVGHTLGLRHNFAGSVAGSYPMAKRDGLVNEYLHSQSAPDGITVASTVMDYLGAEDDFMLGNQIAQGKTFDYDVKAIKTLYDGAQIPDQEWPLFCTDSTMGKFYDCRTWDQGSSELEFNSYKEGQTLDRLPNSILEQYIDAKTPSPGQPAIPVEKVKLSDPELMALAILKPREDLLNQFTKAGAILRIQRQHPVYAGFNRDEVRHEQMRYLESEIDRLGGFDSAFASLPQGYVDKAMARLDELLDKSYRQGIGEDEQSYSFSDDEIKTIRANARLFFEEFDKHYRKHELEVLAGINSSGKFVRDPLSDKLAAYLAKRARDIVMSTTGQFLTADVDLPPPYAQKGTKEYEQTTRQTVKLPVFTYNTELRLLAGDLLSSSRSSDIMWALQERTDLEDDFTQLMKDSFGGVSEDRLNIAKLPEEMRRWLNENRRVSSSL